MLGKLLLVVSIFAFANGFLFAQKPAETKPTESEKQKGVIRPSEAAETTIKLIEGKVTEVYDGDTVSVETKDRKTYTVRMLGIDAPEDKQTFAAQSKKRLSDLTEGKRVTVLVKKKDVYNRYLGTVYSKGKDVNLELIKAGTAWHHAPYANEQAADDRKTYAAAEQKARMAKIGLWAKDDPLPPWEYGRRVQKTTNAAADQKTPDQDKNGNKQSTAEMSPNETLKKAASPAGTNKSGERKYIRGERGGCYYINASGRKQYVDHSLCN